MQFMDSILSVFDLHQESDKLREGGKGGWVDGNTAGLSLRAVVCNTCHNWVCLSFPWCEKLPVVNW